MSPNQRSDSCAKCRTPRMAHRERLASRFMSDRARRNTTPRVPIRCHCCLRRKRRELTVSLYVYGFGGLAKETRMWAVRAGLLDSPDHTWGGYVLTDPSYYPATDDGQIVGDEAWLLSRSEPSAVVLGFADPARRALIGSRLQAAGVALPRVIDPTVVYDESSCTIEDGAVVTAGCVLTVNVVVRRFAYLNISSTFGHSAVIGEGTVVNPGCNVSGDVVVGPSVLIGSGATILEKRRIGAGATVGGGALVNRDVEGGSTVVGVPARPVGFSGR